MVCWHVINHLKKVKKKERKIMPPTTQTAHDLQLISLSHYIAISPSYLVSRSSLQT